MSRRIILPLLLGFSLLIPVAWSAPNAKALSLFKKALEENQAKNHGAALKLYFDAHGEDPEILAMDDEGLLRSASNWLDDQLAADDSDIHAHFQMAELNMLQGLDRMALGHYERVVDLDPNSPLAKLAGPLIQDLQDRINQSQSGGQGGGGSSSSSGGSSNAAAAQATQNAQLKQEMDQLRNELSRTKDQLRKAQADLRALQNNGQATAQLDKLRREFDAYRAEAEQWKTFRNLYFNERSKNLGR